MALLDLDPSGDIVKDKVQIIQHYIDHEKESLLWVNKGKEESTLSHQIRYARLYSMEYEKGKRPLPLTLKTTNAQIDQIMSQPIIVRK